MLYEKIQWKLDYFTYPIISLRDVNLMICLYYWTHREFESHKLEPNHIKREISKPISEVGEVNDNVNKFTALYMTLLWLHRFYGESQWIRQHTL